MKRIITLLTSIYTVAVFAQSPDTKSTRILYYENAHEAQVMTSAEYATLMDAASPIKRKAKKGSGAFAAGGDTIQYYDFSTATVWTAQTGTAGGATIGWKIGQGASNTTWYGNISPFLSTSGGDYAVLDPGNPNSAGIQGVPRTFSLSLNTPVPCATYPAVYFSWEQSMARFTDTCYVDISSNGSTWTNVYDNLDLPITSVQGGTNVSPNPEKIVLNITSLAGGQATVYVRFRWVSLNQGIANDGVGYGWYVDDALFFEAPNNSVSMEETFFRPYSDTTYLHYNKMYTKIPARQANSANFLIGAKYSNSGSLSQSNAGFKAGISGPGNFSYSSTSVLQNLNVNSTDSTSLINPFSFNNGTGLYTVDIHGVSDSALADVPDDTIQYNIEVTDSTYARDLDNPNANSATYWTGGTAGFPDKWEMGQLFEINELDTIVGAQIYLPSTNATGPSLASVHVNVYNQGGYLQNAVFLPAAAPIFTSDTFGLNANNTGRWLTVPLNRVPTTGVGDTLGQGFYVVSIQADQFFGADTVYFGISDEEGYYSSNFIRIDGANSSGFGQWSATSNVFFIRMLTKPFQCPTMQATPVEVTQANCGQSDGEVSITPGNGTAPYTYLWDAAAGSVTSQNAANLPAGIYSVTVTDAQNCFGIFQVPLSNIGAPAITGVSLGDEDCFGDEDGYVSIQTSGGTGTLTYTWKDGLGAQIASAANLDSIGGLKAGSYTVEIQDQSTTPCLQSRSFTVGGPLSPLVLASRILSPNNSGDPLNCDGDTDGEIRLAFIGGTELAGGGYNYAWSDAGSVNSATRTGLSQGNYTVTVTDANGCELAETVAFTAPRELEVLDIPASSYGVSYTNNDTKADIDANVIGGTSPYSFTWTLPDGTVENTPSASLIAREVQGIYKLDVVDDRGCTGSGTFTVGRRVGFGENIANLGNISVFPNPNTGSFNLNFSNVGNLSYEVSVKNLIGQTIVTETLDVNGSLDKTYDLNNEGKGVYFITISNGINEDTQRVVVK